VIKLDKQIQKLIKRLIYQINNSNEPELKVMWKKDERNFDFKNWSFENYKKLASMAIYGENVNLFEEICVKLRKEPYLEHLEHEEIANELWNLLFDFFLGGAKFNEVKCLIQKFENRIEESFINWFVYFPLKNFEFNFDFEFYPYKIVRNYLKEKKTIALGKLPESADWPAVEITVYANNQHSALVKAKKRFMEFCTIISMAHRQSTWDGWAKLPFPEFYFITNENQDQIIQNPTLSRQIYGCTEVTEAEFLKNLNKFQNMVTKGESDRTDIEKRIFRAMEWFFKANTTRDIPDQINYYFFALEALLTTIDDRFKGEALVIRINLLTMRLDQYHRIPGNFYWLYLLRSNLVHGSEDPTSFEPVYAMSFSQKMKYYNQFATSLEDEVRKVISLYLNLINEIQPKKLKDIINWLETKDAIYSSLINWIKEFYSHERLIKYLKIHFNEE